ncbi:ribose-phosphate pyrophosphokinase [Mycoplasmopsis canis UFG4]|uniref:Ribose-phosphate pyrophosphokinase n=2 Tax=Mycoplasmopsis canis TaxID=29555 RepID=I1A4J0_9BACT|nr:ribose-phosphate pyrophosphokinase [Mycoplasmopsis canis]AKF41391.1 ribose-phosphate pyrophosphokinase [Mycoplasmopsis canis]AMD81511.1 ribose-phosphate pyrophosphokinase [Mycoplasmopsis canis PG 14]EIE39319.1 ribose-phosphate pyrophosphokinase [Mycoplasmopsis canis UF33]EIE39470.1 ribose-phosphate pyrophosphokinase [Mycoplasmopsis canis PG 14]EIE39626.1 ribose-phosphate pyrophosphokinase [Mycoplasmopsis canis UF31]
MDKKNTVLFGMNNSINLAKEVADLLGMELSKIERTVYADGEVMLVSEPTVRDKDVFIIASTSRPVNDNIMELLLFIDSLKRGSAKTINVVLSYYGYARQDRKASGRQPIGAKLVADLLQKAGATKITCVDLHNPSIQGFFDIPVDDLKGQYPIAIALKETGEKFTVVSPDHGGTVRARKLAELIADTVQICIIDKRRIGTNQTEVMGILGNIDNQNAVIIDDIIDTGGTILKAVETLKANGAKKVIVAATHGIFTKGFEIFENHPAVEKVIVTNSIDNYELARKFKKLEIVSLGVFLSRVINASLTGNSISQIYKDFKTEISSK